MKTAAFGVLAIAGIVLGGASVVAAQNLFPAGQPAGQGAQWNLQQFAQFLLYVAGAIGSGALLAYHPHYLRRVASLEESDYPKIIITYTVVGALVGTIVWAIPAMGLAIFGVGGLMRFRTELQSAKATGRVIFATLIGMAWGVESWPVAIAMTAIAWILVLLLDWRVAYRMLVRGIGPETIADSAAAYQGVLEEYGCRISQVKKNPRKEQFSIVFKSSRRYDREDFEAAFGEDVDEKLQGSVDWPEEG